MQSSLAHHPSMRSVSAAGSKRTVGEEIGFQALKPYNNSENLSQSAPLLMRFLMLNLGVNCLQHMVRYGQSHKLYHSQKKKNEWTKGRSWITHLNPPNPMEYNAATRHHCNNWRLESILLSKAFSKICQQAWFSPVFVVLCRRNWTPHLKYVITHTNLRKEISLVIKA